MPALQGGCLLCRGCPLSWRTDRRRASAAGRVALRHSGAAWPRRSRGSSCFDQLHRLLAAGSSCTEQAGGEPGRRPPLAVAQGSSRRREIEHGRDCSRPAQWPIAAALPRRTSNPSWGHWAAAARPRLPGSRPSGVERWGLLSSFAGPRRSADGSLYDFVKRRIVGVCIWSQFNSPRVSRRRGRASTTRTPATVLASRT